MGNFGADTPAEIKIEKALISQYPINDLYLFLNPAILIREKAQTGMLPFPSARNWLAALTMTPTMQLANYLQNTATVAPDPKHLEATGPWKIGLKAAFS